jgi:hypothetical protein
MAATRNVTIRHHSDEGACEECGAPLYVGDTYIEHDDKPLCSQVCLGRHKEREEKKAATRRRRNASARDRAAVYSSLGMKRVRGGGGWE